MTRTNDRTITALVLGIALALLTPAYAGAEPPEEPEEDLTAPVITITPPVGGVDGWYADNPVDVHVQATDPGTDASGVQLVGYTVTGSHNATGRVANVGGGIVQVSTNGRSTVTVEATDRAGNTATKEVQVGLDRGRPSVIYSGRVTPGAVFAQGEQVVLQYACTDDWSGVASCAGPVPSGGLLDTSTVGVNRTVQVTATDRVGWQLTHIVHYAVVEAKLNVVSPVTMSGSGVIAEELTGLAGEFTPSPTTIEYAWHRDGQPIPGAVGLTYRPRAADVGHAVTLVATAKRNDFADGRSESEPITVTPGELQLSEAPTLRGEVRVGGELTVDHTPVFPGGATTTYRWFRGRTQIPGADQPTYRLGVADVGHQVKAYVDAELDGYHDESYATAPSAAVPALPLVVTGQTTISGTARVGSTLTASVPTIAPAAAAPGTAVQTAVQWLRDGQPVPGATGRTHALGAADVGYVLSVRTTGSAPGHDPVTLTSAPTAATTKAATALKATAKAKGRVVRLTVRASSPGITPGGTVVVKARGKVVARVTLKAGTGTARVKGLRSGRTTLTASYAGTAVTTSASAKVTVKVPRR